MIQKPCQELTYIRLPDYGSAPAHRYKLGAAVTRRVRGGPVRCVLGRPGTGAEVIAQEEPGQRVVYIDLVGADWIDVDDRRCTAVLRHVVAQHVFARPHAVRASRSREATDAVRRTCLAEEGALACSRVRVSRGLKMRARCRLVSSLTRDGGSSVTGSYPIQHHQRAVAGPKSKTARADFVREGAVPELAGRMMAALWLRSPRRLTVKIGGAGLPSRLMPCGSLQARSCRVCRACL